MMVVWLVKENWSVKRNWPSFLRCWLTLWNLLCMWLLMINRDMWQIESQTVLSEIVMGIDDSIWLFSRVFLPLNRRNPLFIFQKALKNQLPCPVCFFSLTLIKIIIHEMYYVYRSQCLHDFICRKQTSAFYCATLWPSFHIEILCCHYKDNLTFHIFK